VFEVELLASRRSDVHAPRRDARGAGRRDRHRRRHPARAGGRPRRARLGAEAAGALQGRHLHPHPAVAALVRDGAIDLATLADLLGRPLALDAAEVRACLGVAAADRARTLASLDAPDFTLPDLDGRPHTLSAYRGKKIFLIAFASW
jgi:hypothetical protein